VGLRGRRAAQPGVHVNRPVRLAVLAAPLSLLLAACSGGGDDSPPAPPVTAALTTGEAAQVVIGQASFTVGSVNRGGAVAANTISDPWGNPAVVGGRLYLPDFGNNRVLGFNAVPTANGAAADFVLGQADLISSTGGISATRFSSPETVASSAGKLVMADADNYRVLVWNAVPTSTNAAADVVVGKPDLTSTAIACTASSTYIVEGVATANGKLVVADTQHHRVLVWNTIPTASGQAADLVLGQPDFTTCTANTGGLSASRMSRPEGVWTDGTRLLVADSNNARVLLWTTFPTANGEAADVVLGQAGFGTNAGVVTATGMLWPTAVSSNGTQIAVADCTANRVLVWNAFPTTNGAPADAVLGQADFVSSVGATSAAGMSCPGSVLLEGDMLVTGEWDNNRYLIFR
jgi:hypothetical protein